MRSPRISRIQSDNWNKILSKKFKCIWSIQIVGKRFLIYPPLDKKNEETLWYVKGDKARGLKGNRRDFGKSDKADTPCKTKTV